MKLFNGDPVEIVLTPSQIEIDRAVRTASKLMAEKIEKWILDQLTIEQLENCIKQFQQELKSRKNEND